LGFLKRWWLLIVLGPVVAGAAGYVFVAQVPPVYQANTTLLVVRGTFATTGVDDPAGAESLGRTYAEALKTRPVLENAAQRIGQGATARDLQQNVAVRPVTGTQLLRLTVEDRNPARAADAANAIVAVFTEQNLEMQAGRYASSRQNLEQLVATLRVEIDSRSAELQKLRSSVTTGDPQLARLETEYAQLQATYSDSVRTYESLRVSEARGLNGLMVVEPAVPPVDPVRPNKLQTVALAVLAGLVIAVAFAKLIEYLDDGLRTRERLASATGLRALASIPRWHVSSGGLIARQVGEGSADRTAMRAAEGYRLLFGTLTMAGWDALGDQSPKALIVTSAAMDEGKSLTAANLAAVFAESGRRVILVDADVHRPSQMRRFDLSNRTGFSTLLINPNLSLESVLRETPIPGLRVLPAGPAPAAPSSLYTSRHLASRLAELRQHCDLVVFDTPPVLAQADAALLSPHADGVIFVVDAQKSRGRQVRRALEMLSEAGAQVLGAAFNRVSPRYMDYVQYQSYTAAKDAQPEDAVTQNKSVGTAARGEAT
jgi:capsular exopolysaccharide synthesis family protein